MIRLAAIIALLLAVGALTGRAVGLAWDYPANQPVSGFTVYYGARSRGYTNSVFTTNHSAVVGGLRTGVNYFFAVTAMDDHGLESDYSEEVHCIAGLLEFVTIQVQTNGLGSWMLWTNRWWLTNGLMPPETFFQLRVSLLPNVATLQQSLTLSNWADVYSWTNSPALPADTQWTLELRRRQ